MNQTHMHTYIGTYVEVQLNVVIIPENSGPGKHNEILITDY